MQPCRPDADFDAMSIDTLKEIVARCAANFMENVLTIAKAMAALVKKGEDVSDWEIIPSADAKLIAEGVLLPSTWVKLGARRSLMRIVGSLPPSEQDRLCRDKDPEPLPVAERLPDGTLTHRMYTVERLPNEFIRQVFDYRRIRPLQEQSALPPEPVNRPVLDTRPVEVESLRAELSKQVEVLGVGDKRQKRKAVREAREVLEKIALLVQ